MTSIDGRPTSAPPAKRRRTTQVGRTGARFGPIGIQDQPEPEPTADHTPQPSSDPTLTGARFGPHSARRRKRDTVHDDEQPHPDAVQNDGRFRHSDTEQTGPIQLAPAPRTGDAGSRAASRESHAEGLPSESDVLIRPYARTGGRTKPAHDLAIESLVLTSGAAEQYRTWEQRMIANLCLRPRSVAEVAALLSIPLGVARVLLVDMATAGLVVVHGGMGDRAPDLALMRRVLAGLRRL